MNVFFHHYTKCVTLFLFFIIFKFGDLFQQIHTENHSVSDLDVALELEQLVHSCIRMEIMK